jgi:hypothetical protein
MKRKTFIYALLAAPLLIPQRSAAAAPLVSVFKDPNCGCCGKWVEHLRTSGFQVSVQEVRDLATYRRKFGVPDALASCHTATIGDYVVEGHVPVREIQRILKERPKAKGLAVPGMPLGSPGMESAKTQAYSVLLFDVNGRETVYQSYPAK